VSHLLALTRGSSFADHSEEELPFLVAHLSLFSADGSVALDVGSSPGGTHRRVLYGKLVAEPQNLLDVNGKQCLFFVFSDVSIRWCGQYQLGISLMRLSWQVMPFPREVCILTALFFSFFFFLGCIQFRLRWWNERDWQ
jgi:hypothetical protein